MAAGQGFKTFVTGEVLTAGDVNGYLMQGINVFTNATARDAAITAPAEGQFAFTKDNNSLWYYDGAAWVASGATGDIEGVTAGVGISGGGTSGTVTVTNSMATAIDAKGDLVPGTGADTFARLAVGANDTVLTADSSTATGLKWALASGGGMTLLSTTSLSGSTTTVSSIDGTYVDLVVIVQGMTFATDAAIPQFRFNGSNLVYASGTKTRVSTTSLVNTDGVLNVNNEYMTNTNANNVYVMEITNYANTTRYKGIKFFCNSFSANPAANSQFQMNQMGGVQTNSAITSFSVTNNEAYTFDGGEILIYGVK